MATALGVGLLIGFVLMLFLRQRARSSARRRGPAITAAIAAQLESGEVVDVIVKAYVPTGMTAKGTFLVLTNRRLFVLFAKSLEVKAVTNRSDISGCSGGRYMTIGLASGGGMRFDTINSPREEMNRIRAALGSAPGS